ncbi:hypothetical protein ACIBCD_34235 [Nocardia brasiliensis]|uniref:hypothetical protein n=1 Tax=Nocardia brasiliensis TaxID=37326 RepID=UPI00378DFA55
MDSAPEGSGASAPSVLAWLELPFGLGAGLTGIVTAVAFLATFSVCLKRRRRDS